MTAAPAPAPAAAPPIEAPPAPVAIAPVDPLTFTEDAPAFSAETIAILETPVNPELVEVRQPNDLLFVPWVHYQAILRKAFGPGGFRMVPRAVARQEGNVVTWVGALFVRPPGERKFQFIKEAKGECGMHGGMTMGNAAEGAQSDCLVKCCKALGIFMELFDPAWRRAWESKYKATHLAAKGKREWVSRDRASGGAGAAPSAAPPSQPSAAPADSSPSTAPAAAAGKEPSPSTSAPADTGEAASAEQLEAIRGALKRLQWKVGFLKIWFDQRFGIKVPPGASVKEVGARLLGALTQQQADTAHLLLNAFGTNVYERLLAEAQGKGACR